MNAVIQIKPRINLTNETRVERYQELGRQIAKRQAELNEIKAQLIASLDENNEIRNRHGEIIAWLKQTTYLSFNSDQFKKDFGDIYAGYKTKTIHRDTFKTA